MIVTEELEVFKLAHQSALRIYERTSKFPSHEMYGLVSQLRRAASSVGANLVEGGARTGRKEYRQFVGVARASAAEVRYHLLLAKDLGYISEVEHSEFSQAYVRVGKMLAGLISSLSRRSLASEEQPIPNPQSPIPV